MTIPPDPKRGEVWRVDLDPTVGDEMRKICPAVIVSAGTIGRLNLRIIVPITAWDERYRNAPWMVPLDPDPDSGLTKPSADDTFQLRSLSTARMVGRIGVLPEDTLDAIAAGIALCVRHRPR